MLTISKRWTGWQTGVHDTNLYFPVGFKMFILKSCKKKDALAISMWLKFPFTSQSTS